MAELMLKKWGNSLGVILPAEKLKKLNLQNGDRIEVEILSKRRIDAFGIAKGAKPFRREHDDRERF